MHLIYEYIKNFNSPSWQSVLKTELESRIGEQAMVEIISIDFKSDEIIDNPEMGYGVLCTVLLKHLFCIAR